MSNSTLSKTTINFANRRGVFVGVWITDDEENQSSHIYITDLNDDSSDAELVYNLDTERGVGYQYASNTWLPDSVKEELPAFIKDESHLREVIGFIASELK